MPSQTLTIEGITFPKFDKSSSKRNFRLIIYLAYKDATGKNQTAIVTKPATGQWQSKKSDGPNFLAEGNDLGDSVALDVAALRFDANGFSSTDFQIAEIDGDLTAVSVQFIDVFDPNVGDFLKEKLLPQVLAELKAAGFTALASSSIPGLVLGVLKDKVDVEDFATKVEGYLLKVKKDKLLHQVSSKYNGENPFTLSGSKIWDTKKKKTGTFALTIGFE